MLRTKKKASIQKIWKEFSDDICKEFGLGKCTYFVRKNGARADTEHITDNDFGMKESETNENTIT